MMGRNSWFGLGTAMALLAGCSSSSDGGTIVAPPGNLNYLHLAQAAPPLCADSVGEWFVKDPNGNDHELALEFPENGNLGNCAGGNNEEFISIKVDKDGLFKRPDGSTIADGDSVFISIVWVGGDSVLFHLSPTGLLFNTAKPTELKIGFGESEEASDSTIISQIAIWRQATLLDDFVKLNSNTLEVEEELEVKINGFSRYAIAY